MTVSVNELLKRLANKTRHKIGPIKPRFRLSWLEYVTVCEYCDAEIVILTKVEAISINNQILGYKKDDQWVVIPQIEERSVCERVRNLA